MDKKLIIRRFVDEAVNGGRAELIDELITGDTTAWVRDWFGAFRRSFPDLNMRIVDLVAEGDTVVARCTCSATHRGEWRGHPPTGRRFENVESTSSPSAASGSRRCGGWRTRSTASASCGSRPPHLSGRARPAGQ